jgi:hypothetical protein
MALTVSNRKYENQGSIGCVYGTIAFDNSYPTGGEALTAAQVGLSRFKRVKISPQSNYLFTANITTTEPTTVNVVVSSSIGGTQEVQDVGGDILGSVTTDVATPGGALPTNGNFVSTLAAADNTTAFTIAASPDIGRNIGIGIENNTGGGATGNAANYVIVGTWRGAAQTETISFSVLELTTITNNLYVYKYGSRPFDTITSITPSAAQPANFRHVAGIGSKVGLRNNLKTPAEADVLKITKNQTNLAPTGIVDTTNMTVNLGTLANGDDFEISYNISSGEVTAATDLSALTAVSFEAYGY